MRFIFLLTGLCSLYWGCKKSEVINIPDWDNYKMYNDTLACGDNPSFAIAAGEGRLFMTYGYNFWWIQANWLADYQNMIPVVMATDNNGNFLWRKKLPEAFDACTVAACDDGGCLVAVHQFWTDNPAYSKDNIYIFRFDKDGNNTKTDSISLLPYFTTSHPWIYWLRSLKNSSGNIIFYGSSEFNTPSTNNFSGIALEYSPYSGVAWIKTYTLPAAGFRSADYYLGGCVQTKEKEYIFSGTVMYLDSSYQWNDFPVLMKTNSLGDTIWTKKFVGIDPYISYNIVSKRDGNYWFCYNSGFNTNIKGVTYIYEVNANGDSLRAAKVDNDRYNYVSSIIETENGSCMALVNQSLDNTITPMYYGNFFRQTNTRKMLFDSNLKQTSDTHFQTLTTDFLPVSCKTSDGRIACFGIQQSAGKSYYQPHLYFLK